MGRYRLKNSKCNRRKAPFGTQEAATLAAAGINAAATIAGAATSAKAAKDAAKEQALALNNQTNRQVQSLKDQAQKEKEIQLEQQEFISNQNEENRQIQKDMQMQMQMLMAQQNNNARLDASRIQVRNGGCKRRLASGGNIVKGTHPLLRGANLGFKIEGPGAAKLEGITPEGYELYEILGNDHDHYHKYNGKYETGVGVRFSDGELIELQGNQNTKKGEKLLVTPDNAYAISKNSIAGYNPAKAVDNGEHPLVAFANQEIKKEEYGISDDGKAPRRKGKLGLTTSPLLSSTYTDINNTNTTPLMGEISLLGKRKYAKGGWLISPSISAGFNLLGTGIANAGNRKAANLLSNAYLNSGQRLANAYQSLKTVDLNGLSDSLRNTYSAAHVMPALQTPTSYANQPLADVDRSLQRRLANAERNSASSMVANTRSNLAEVDAQDARNRIYSADQQQMQQVRNENARQISEASKTNAMLDTEANNRFAAAYLDLAKYNNNIENERILGSANALSDAEMGSSEVLGQARAANATAWGATGQRIGQGFASALDMQAKRDFEYNTALMKASPEQATTASIYTDDKTRGEGLFNAYSAIANDEGQEEKVRREYARYAEMLNSKFGYNTNWKNPYISTPKLSSISPSLNYPSLNYSLSYK